MSDENINPDAPLHIRGLNHLTIPVEERYRAARFYIVALGAEAHHESAPDRVAKGLSRSLQFGIRMAANFEIDLFEQEFGQPDWNQSHRSPPTVNPSAPGATPSSSPPRAANASANGP